MRTRTRQAILALVTAAFALAPSSCGLQQKGGGATTGKGPVIQLTEGDHPFAPVRLVIHPLTRVVRDPATGEERIEVHLELQDRWEDSVKWLGVVVFELFREAPTAINGPGGHEEVKSWKVDLSQPEENSRPYDRVTRTYRLTLVGLPDSHAYGASAGSMRLTARFTTIEGRTLTATYKLED